MLLGGGGVSSGVVIVSYVVTVSFDLIAAGLEIYFLAAGLVARSSRWSL